MSAGRARWPLAVVLSTAANAALVAGLALAVRPGPPPPPDPMPETRLDIARTEVAETSAQAAPARGETGQVAAAAGQPALAGAVPTSRAGALAPEADTIAAARAAGQSARAATADGLALAPGPTGATAPPQAARAPSAAAAPLLSPTGDSAEPVSPDAARLAAGAPPQSAARPLSPGTGAASPAPLPASDIAVSATAPAGAAAPSAQPAASRVAAATAPGARLREAPPPDARAARPPQEADAPALAAVLSAPAKAQTVPLPAETLADARPDATGLVASTAAEAGSAAPAALPSQALGDASVEATATVAAAALTPEAARDTEPAAPSLAASPAGTGPTLAALPAGPAALDLRAGRVPATDAPVDTPRGEGVAPRAAEGTALQPQDAAPDRATAALAWTGGAEARIDPAALEAIAAYMQPGDAAASAGASLQDSIAGLLASVSCARLRTRLKPETGELELAGHIPDTGLRAPVLTALEGAVGDALPVTDRLLILPRPQCGALAGMERVGLPQSTDQAETVRTIGATIQARTFRFVEEERLVLEFEAPDYPAFVYVDFYTADGRVLHLVPNAHLPLRRHAPAEVVQIGARKGEEGLALIVEPPFGTEIAVAFAASHPLYEGLRPVSEAADAYLRDLAALVDAARARHEDFRGEWVYFFVETGPA